MIKHINEIVAIVSLIAMFIFCGNIPFTIMNGFLIVMNILFVIVKRKNREK